MKNFTEEEIARATDDLEGTSNIRAINKMFRLQDTSNLWPVSGKFNATNRAIRRAQKWQRESGVSLQGLEYCYFISSEISSIVNNPNI